MAKVKFTCLFCEKQMAVKKAAKAHSCSEKKAAEKRLGVCLSTYDPVQRAIEILKQRAAHQPKEK